MRDVLKRSESLSPRHERDWKQLSDRFSSEENIIDIDNLRATSLGSKPRTPESQIEIANTVPVSSSAQQPPKELTLSGGGAIFLKSNRSRDTTPCHDGERSFGDIQTTTVNLSIPSGSVEEMSTSAGERLKSILREKTSEDGEALLVYEP